MSWLGYALIGLLVIVVTNNFSEDNLIRTILAWLFWPLIVAGVICRLFGFKTGLGMLD
jgi:hypothetical protein